MPWILCFSRKSIASCIKLTKYSSVFWGTKRILRRRVKDGRKSKYKAKKTVKKLFSKRDLIMANVGIGSLEKLLALKPKTQSVTTSEVKRRHNYNIVKRKHLEILDLLHSVHFLHLGHQLVQFSGHLMLSNDHRCIAASFCRRCMWPVARILCDSELKLE